jgi:hypothetical protein
MQVRHTNQRRNGFTGNARRRLFSCTIYAAVKGTTSAAPVSHAPLARLLSASPAAPRARPQNDKGQNVDLYIPRKCSWTHRLITVHDHAAIQVRVASGRRRAAAALPRSLVSAAGAPAPTSLAPPPFPYRCTLPRWTRTARPSAGRRTRTQSAATCAIRCVGPQSTLATRAAARDRRAGAAAHDVLAAAQQYAKPLSSLCRSLPSLSLSLFPLFVRRARLTWH